MLMNSFVVIDGVPIYIVLQGKIIIVITPKYKYLCKPSHIEIKEPSSLDAFITWSYNGNEIYTYETLLSDYNLKMIMQDCFIMLQNCVDAAQRLMILVPQTPSNYDSNELYTWYIQHRLSEI